MDIDLQLNNSHIFFVNLDEDLVASTVSSFPLHIVYIFASAGMPLSSARQHYSNADFSVACHREVANLTVSGHYMHMIDTNSNDRNIIDSRVGERAFCNENFLFFSSGHRPDSLNSNL